MNIRKRKSKILRNKKLYPKQSYNNRKNNNNRGSMPIRSIWMAILHLKISFIDYKDNLFRSYRKFI